MLALSILAVTVSRRSSALSRPVAENDSGSSGGAPALLDSRSPPAAIAPGPAGFGVLEAAFLPPAFGAALTLAGADVSSSASSLAFSALRASSALRLSSFSSFFLLAFAPSSHFEASERSYVICVRREIVDRVETTYLCDGGGLLLLGLVLRLLCAARLLLCVSTLWCHDYSYLKSQRRWW